MGGVAEIDLVGMDAYPFGAQATGEIAAETGRNPLHDHQPYRGGNGKGGQAHALVRPGRHHRQAETRSEEHQQKRHRRSGERPADDRTPADGRGRRFLRNTGNIGGEDRDWRLHAGLLAPEQQDEDDDRNRNSEKPKQNSTAHSSLHSKMRKLFCRQLRRTSGATEVIRRPWPSGWRRNRRAR